MILRWLTISAVATLMMGCERESEQTPAAESAPSVSSGFVHYDWIPRRMKHTMDHLQTLHPRRVYSYCYYFTVDDINRHFHLDDAGLGVVAEITVSNEDALRFIDDKLYNIEANKWGAYQAWDTTEWRKKRRSFYPNRTIKYILTEDPVDFTQLRLAIVEDTAIQELRSIEPHSDPKLYSSSEVDQPAEPMRGWDYFRRAIENEVRDAEAFLLYDTGTVEVAFTVWGKRARSPNLIRGFSSHSNAHEAYQADGEFIKAINDAKVWWHDARKQNRPVQSTVRMTFDVSQLKNE